MRNAMYARSHARTQLIRKRNSTITRQSHFYCSKPQTILKKIQQQCLVLFISLTHCYNISYHLHLNYLCCVDGLFDLLYISFWDKTLLDKCTQVNKLWYQKCYDYWSVISTHNGLASIMLKKKIILQTISLMIFC